MKKHLFLTGPSGVGKTTIIKEALGAQIAYAGGFLTERVTDDSGKLLGFDLLPGEHPIVPVMLYDPKIAGEFARRMLEKGVYVVGFCYPVVPKGRDRVRTQISAGHTKEDLDFAVRCFGEVKKEMGL